MQSKKTWRKALLINGCGIVALLLSIFTVPPDTPVWMWATVCVTALIAVNCWWLIFRSEEPATPRPRSWLKTTIILVGTLYFGVQVVMGIIRYAR